MKLLFALMLAVLAGCTQPPQQAAAPCPDLPRPLGDTIAAQRAYTLLVVQLYAQCAFRQ